MAKDFIALGTERKYFKYQNSIKMKEIEALQNAANNTGAAGLEVKQKIHTDKRYKTRAYFLTLNGTCISPVLDYDRLNHFILGFSRAKSIYNN